MVSHRIRPTVALAVAALFLTPYALAGCGEKTQADPQASAGSTANTPAPTASATPSATPSTAPPVDREITVTVAKKKVTPAPDRIPVAKGSTVRITVTSDVKDELHVHGYDLKAALPAGVPSSVQFRADKDGLFEVETHETKLVLCQLLVR